jgi:hypothetical protein
MILYSSMHRYQGFHAPGNAQLAGKPPARQASWQKSKTEYVSSPHIRELAGKQVLTAHLLLSSSHHTVNEFAAQFVQCAATSTMQAAWLAACFTAAATLAAQAAQ